MATKKKTVQMFKSFSEIDRTNPLHLAVLRASARNMAQDDLASGTDPRYIFSALVLRFMDGLETEDEDNIEHTVLEEVNFMAKDFTEEDVEVENARNALDTERLCGKARRRASR